MSLLDTLITTISALAGLTAKNGHTYTADEKPGIVLVTVQKGTIILEGLQSDEWERPFQLKLYAKNQADQDTFAALIRTAINVNITNGYWKIMEEEPDPLEKRRNLVFYGKQVKVE